MLSRREKQNLLYLVIGIIIGIVTVALVAYFGVISRFTKENIVKIYNVLPSSDTTNVGTKNVNLNRNEQVFKNVNHSLSDTSAKNKVEMTVKQDTMPSKEIPITIKTDTKIAEASIPIFSFVQDTLSDVKGIAVQKGELQVEQWDNPTNFAGYRKTQNKLIVYGISIDNIELQLIDDNLYLIFNQKRLLLKDSDSFLRYPSEFLR